MFCFIIVSSTETYLLWLVKPSLEASLLSTSSSNVLALIPGPVRIEPLLAFYTSTPAAEARVNTLSTTERLLLRTDILRTFSEDANISRALQLDALLGSLECQRQLIDQSVASLWSDIDNALRECAPAFSAFMGQWLRDHPAPVTTSASTIASLDTTSLTPATPAVPPPIIATSGPQVPDLVEDAVSLGSSDDEDYLARRK